MLTTIDSAGRLVVPKAVRDAMGLTPGVAVDVSFTDGRIEIEFAPLKVSVESRDGLPVIVPRGEVAGLSDEAVRATLESTRR